MNPIESSLAGNWRVKRARLRDRHAVELALVRGRIQCSDGDGLEASRLHVEAGDTVTWRCETHDWRVDFGRLSPFERARIDGVAGESVTLRVKEDALSGVEYRYFATLAIGTGEAARAQPLVIVEPYAVPGLY